MRYDIRYLRKYRGWPDLPKPLWQKVKRFLDEKTDSFRVEYDYKAVEVKPLDKMNFWYLNTMDFGNNVEDVLNTLPLYLSKRLNNKQDDVAGLQGFI
jgi:hypothetical protein